MNARAAITPAVLRCAIYTRKSSDEGLEQSFNSLHAQREACEAYIQSQTHEGWTCRSDAYDDGGFSGGSMERPGLQQLLADIEAGEIDVVVVYKVDRLTRSLTDFARIVERFDGAGVSFVSVTQAFNTTTSMGRLTLNVLLSFAQFEREVTGERIRDKIAASKAKGMWMGGCVPLGYDAGDHKLVVNEAEAATVRAIFERYLKLGSVSLLRDELERQGVRSKRRVTRAGEVLGGQTIERGALFHLLQNPHYIGQIRHRDAVHAGLHDAIVDQKLFEAVQRKLARNRIKRRERPPARIDALLTGKLFDQSGRPYSPAFAYGKSGRRYGYYTLTDLQRGLIRAEETETPARIPIAALDAALLGHLARLTGRVVADARVLLSMVRRLEVRPDEARLTLDPKQFFADDHPELGFEDLQLRLAPGERAALTPGRALMIVLPGRLQFRGGRTWSSEATRPPKVDPVLVRGLRAAHRLARKHGVDPISVSPSAKAPTDPYERKLCALVMLAPDIQERILEGRHGPDLNMARLLAVDIPPGWEDQRRLLGIRGR